MPLDPKTQATLDAMRNGTYRNPVPDMFGRLHRDTQGAIDANLNGESQMGQWVTGGNCGQDPKNVKPGQ
jgi:hypothetical protein